MRACSRTEWTQPPVAPKRATVGFVESGVAAIDMFYCCFDRVWYERWLRVVDYE